MNRHLSSIMYVAICIYKTTLSSVVSVSPLSEKKKLCLTSQQQLRYSETGPQLIVSSDKLVKPGIKPTTPGLQGE